MHYDAKVAHVGTSTYPDTNGAAAARGRAAVNTRARRVVSEYARHTRKIDAHCAGTAPNDDGPVLRRLREVGITGIAFGAFGEAPDDAHRLLKVIAVAGFVTATAVGHRRAEAREQSANVVCLRTAALPSSVIHRLCPPAVYGGTGRVEGVHGLWHASCLACCDARTAPFPFAPRL